MKKILSVLCITSFLISGIPTISVNAEGIREESTEATDIERASWYLSYHNINVSNYNGSLCVNTVTRATESMEEIGIKDLIVQYSYNGNNWYNEWNAGDFLDYNTNGYELNNYIMALDRSGCYYRVSCTHYAKKAFLNTQSVNDTSNAVWIW